MAHSLITCFKKTFILFLRLAVKVIPMMKKGLNNNFIGLYIPKTLIYLLIKKRCKEENLSETVLWPELA